MACCNRPDPDAAQEGLTPAAWYERAELEPSWVRPHAPRLRELARGASLVVEFADAPGPATAALLMGAVEARVCLKVYCVQAGGDAANSTALELLRGTPATAEPHPGADLVVYSGRRPPALGELERHASDRIVLLRGGPPAEFLRAHPEWSVLEAKPGLVVLSRRGEDHKPLPGAVELGWNYVKAKAKHWWSGKDLLAEDIAQARYELCLACPERAADRCSVCGCYLLRVAEDEVLDPGGPGKVWHASEGCPLDKWGSV